MPDVVVPLPPRPPVLPPDDPEWDDPAEPDEPEDEPPPVLNRVTVGEDDVDGFRPRVSARGHNVFNAVRVDG